MDRHLQQHTSANSDGVAQDDRDSADESMPGLEPDPDLGHVSVSSQGAPGNNSSQHQERARNHSTPSSHQLGAATSGINRNHRIWQVSDGIDPLQHSLGPAEEEDDEHHRHNFPLPSLQYLGPGHGGFMLSMPLPLSLAGATVAIGPPGFVEPSNSSRGQEPLFVPGGGLTRPSFRILTAGSRQHRVHRTQRGGSNSSASRGRGAQHTVVHAHNTNAGSSSAGAAGAPLVPDAVAEPASAQLPQADMAEVFAASGNRYRVHARRTRQQPAVGSAQTMTSSAPSSEPFTFRAAPAADLGAASAQHGVATLHQRTESGPGDSSSHNAQCSSSVNGSSRGWWPPWQLFARCVRLLHQLVLHGFSNTTQQTAAAAASTAVRPNSSAGHHPVSFAVDVAGSDASPAAAAPSAPDPLAATNLAIPSVTAGGRRQRSQRRSAAARSGQRRRRGQQHASRNASQSIDDCACHNEPDDIYGADVYEPMSDSDDSQAGARHNRLQPAPAARPWLPNSSSNGASSLPAAPPAQAVTTAAGTSSAGPVQPSPKRNRTSDYAAEAAATGVVGDAVAPAINGFTAAAAPASAAPAGTSTAAGSRVVDTNERPTVPAAESSEDDDEGMPDLEYSSSSDGMPELEVSTSESEGELMTSELSQPPALREPESADAGDSGECDDAVCDDDGDSIPQLEVDRDDVSDGFTDDDDSMPDLEGHSSAAVSDSSMPAQQQEGDEEGMPGAVVTRPIDSSSTQQTSAAAGGRSSLEHASGLRRGFFTHSSHLDTDTDPQQQHMSSSAPSTAAAGAQPSHIVPPLVDPRVIDQLLDGLFTDGDRRRRDRRRRRASSDGSDDDWETASEDDDDDDMQPALNQGGETIAETEEMLMRMFQQMSRAEQAGRGQHRGGSRSRPAAAGSEEPGSAVAAPPYSRQRSNGFIVTSTSTQPGQAQQAVGSRQGGSSMRNSASAAQSVVKGLPALSKPSRIPQTSPAAAQQGKPAADIAVPAGMLSLDAAKAKRQQLSTLLGDPSYSDQLLHSLPGVDAADARIVSVLNLLKNGKYELAATATSKGAARQFIAYEDMMFKKRLQRAKQMAWQWRS